MNTPKKSLLLLVFGALIASLNGCATSSSAQMSQNTSSALNPNLIQPSMAQLRAKSAARSLNNVAIQLYTSDSQCQTFIPTKVLVPSEQPLVATVGKILAAQDTADFSLSGYRVKVNPQGVATLDLRMAPNSQRQLVSLSSCEQFSLFGSLRKTLTSNPLLQVKEVRFTERGEQIAL
jgi:hypothetical protein